MTPDSVEGGASPVDLLDAVIAELEERLENVEFMRGMRVQSGSPAFTDQETPMPYVRAFKIDVEALRGSCSAVKSEVDRLRALLAVPRQDRAALRRLVEALRGPHRSGAVMHAVREAEVLLQAEGGS